MESRHGILLSTDPMLILPRAARMALHPSGFGPSIVGITLVAFSFWRTNCTNS